MKTGLFLLSMLSFTLQAKVMLITDHGFSIENRIQTSNSSPIVWQALITDVDKWWPKDHTWWGQEGTLAIEPQAGGCFCESAGKRSAQHMNISFVDPAKTLGMTGGLGPLQEMGMYGALTWKLANSDQGSSITLTYNATGISPNGFEKLAKIVDKVQAMQLAALGQYLKTHK